MRQGNTEAQGKSGAGRQSAEVLTGHAARVARRAYRREYGSAPGDITKKNLQALKTKDPRFSG